MLETVCRKKVLIQSGENPSWLNETVKSYILNWREFQVEDPESGYHSIFSSRQEE